MNLQHSVHINNALLWCLLRIKSSSAIAIANFTQKKYPTQHSLQQPLFKTNKPLNTGNLRILFFSVETACRLMQQESRNKSQLLPPAGTSSWMNIKNWRMNFYIPSWGDIEELIGAWNSEISFNTFSRRAMMMNWNFSFVNKLEFLSFLSHKILESCQFFAAPK